MIYYQEDINVGTRCLTLPSPSLPQYLPFVVNKQTFLQLSADFYLAQNGGLVESSMYSKPLLSCILEQSKL